jgi:putative membrane protein
MGILIEIFVTALAIFLGSKIIPGIHTSNFETALIAAFVFAIVNWSIGNLLRILTFPINFLTLGLCSFLIGALMIYLVGRYLTGFHVDNYTAAILLALLLAVLKIIFSII